MLKPKISFKSKKWTCKKCGLLIEVSKWKIKINSQVFFTSTKLNKNFTLITTTIHGKVIDRQNKFLTIIDNNNNDTYFINQDDVYLEDSPSLFLYNMFGRCTCQKI